MFLLFWKAAPPVISTIRTHRKKQSQWPFSQFVASLTSLTLRMDVDGHSEVRIYTFDLK